MMVAMSQLQASTGEMCFLAATKGRSLEDKVTWEMAESMMMPQSMARGCSHMNS